MLVALESLAFTAGILALIASLWLCYYGTKEGSAPLRVSGCILLVVVLLAQVCLGFHILKKYYFQGADESAYPSHAMMMQGGAMGAGMMSGGMMEGKKMGIAPADAAKAASKPRSKAEAVDPKAEDHTSHH